MIGFVVCLKNEAQGLLEKFEQKTESVYRGRSIFTGLLQGKKCALVLSGVGKVRSASATQMLIEHFPECASVIHFGTGGAIATDLKIGDIILGTEIIGHDHYSHFGSANKIRKAFSDDSACNRFLQFAARTNLQVKSGIILSGDEDIVTTKRRNELFEKFQGLSVDWESYACASVANICKIPCLVLRTISDFAYENTDREFRTNYEAVSAFLAGKIFDFIKDDLWS